MVCTRSSENGATVTRVTHLPLAHEVLPLFPALVKVIASDARISKVSRSHVVTLDLMFCKVSALPLASSRGCKSRKIESAKILLNFAWDLEDFAKNTSGGWGPSATVAFRMLAGLLSDKRAQPYSTTLGIIRCKIAFSLLHSTIMCLRGDRSSFHSPTLDKTGDNDQPLELIASEARLSY